MRDTNEDKRKRTKEVIERYPGQSQRWYASRAGVTQAFVCYFMAEIRGETRAKYISIDVNDTSMAADKLVEYFDPMEIIEAICRSASQ